ncbi:kinase-like domain-containing protein [Tricladium varicosporioides]|nr:kinase-like domain-containing protein [Hymenoscyphus varicosporioides]
MAAQRLPFFIRAGQVVQFSTGTSSNDLEIHFDLLSFISIAQILGVDFINVRWQPSLDSLGGGATSIIQQTQMDAAFCLAFKRPTEWSDEEDIGTIQHESERYKAIIYELIALELLAEHPNVIDLLGVSWETDQETEQVWPVLLTERSFCGNMSEFLNSEDGTVLNNWDKLRLCAEVAMACAAMHSLGIIHGDIKQENVLIFPTNGGFCGKLIDFGFSCLGMSEKDMIQVACTRPWQAPEHCINTRVTMSCARLMDIYSFGMLLCRTFLSDQLPELVGRFRNDIDIEEHQSLVTLTEELKMTDRFLDLVLEALESCSVIEEDCREILQHLFRVTLQHDPSLRAQSFQSIISIICHDDEEKTPATADFSTIRSLAHTVLDIGKVLADLDDSDYRLHQILVADLKSRTSGSKRCPCLAPAARQLWLCHEIGFGCPRNPNKASQWLKKCNNSQVELAVVLKSIDDEYECKKPYRLCQKLGYEINIQFDPIEIYFEQTRTAEAEEALSKEVVGREESMGPQSKSYISLLSTLGLLLSVTGDLESAETACQKAAESSVKAYGEDSSETISAQNYLAGILFRRGKWIELERLQDYLIPIKKSREDIEETDPTILNSHNYLCAAYCFQGQYDKCIDLGRQLLALRTGKLGLEHQETLTSKNWLCRALLEKGEFEGLEDMGNELVSASEKACGPNDEATLERKEVLAGILLGESKVPKMPLNLEKLDESEVLICEVLEEIDKEDKQPDLTLFVRAQTTLICCLSLRGEFEDTILEIQNGQAAIENLRSAGSSENIEIHRFSQVEQCVSTLLELQKPGSDEEARIFDRIAHRWKI